jgi:hypothetical protein
MKSYFYSGKRKSFQEAARQGLARFSLRKPRNVTPILKKVHHQMLFNQKSKGKFFTY